MAKSSDSGYSLGKRTTSPHSSKGWNPPRDGESSDGLKPNPGYTRGQGPGYGEHQAKGTGK
jgi:hypothetical protein